MTQGFAHIDKDGNIDVATVSPTKRAAMVNAIVTLSGGVLIPKDSINYSEIEARYLNMAAMVNGKIAEVFIKVAE